MMVHLCEAQVFKGQVTQAIHGIIGRKLALPYLLEQLADGFGVHTALRTRRSSGADSSLAV